MAVPDVELVERVRQGDVEAFGSLAQRYEKTLLAAALAQMRDIHAAEDVVQGALLHAFQRLGTLQDTSKFGLWLMQIARRRIVDAVRARPRAVTAPLENCEGEGLSGGLVADVWIENEQLLDFVARLPEHERLLIGLRYFDGHSMAELAEITGRPLGTVTKQLSRAIARLRCWWDKENLR